MLFNSVPTISWNDMKDDAMIIDVREPFEFNQFHAHNAKNIPLGSIDVMCKNKKPNHKVYVVCASGSRSKQAVKLLRKCGIEAVNIAGGMMFYGK